MKKIPDYQPRILSVLRCIVLFTAFCAMTLRASASTDENATPQRVASIGEGYNPPSPPDPPAPVPTHSVTISVTPESGGSATSSFDMPEGSSRTIYAYPATGFKVEKWVIDGDIIDSESTSQQITMGTKPIDITVNFKYSPESPANPGANSFDPASGQLIVDDFNPGSLYSAIIQTVNDVKKVTEIIVKGVMKPSDLGAFGYLKNVETVDFSRTSGIEILSGWSFSGTTQSVILPYTINEISKYAFSGASGLTSLTCYAMEPPKCSSQSFNGLDKSQVTVFVPTGAIALYQEAEGWKDFILLPISADYYMLRVNLPGDTADGRYKYNSLEIVNTRTDLRQKYVISDRMQYTFSGVQKDELYNVFMYSQTGLEIGRMENIIIPDHDIDITFDNLKSLYSVSANVYDADGNDVTSQVTAEWFCPLTDGTMTYLRKAVLLGEIPDGQQLICRVTLDNNLGVLYANPEDVEFTVGPDNNVCKVILVPFREINLSGSVADSDGATLSGASISINQTLNGKYSKTYTTKTDRKGQWNLSVLDAPETRITYSASDYINANDTITAFETNINSFDIGQKIMRSIVGARISYGFTYHAAGSEDVQDYYTDYKNVTFNVFNLTQNREHPELSIQYPVLAVLDENINTGDELKVTAISKTGAFNPIEETVTVDENQRGDVSFDIVGKGGISASFEMTDNPSVIAMLYSSKGEFLKKQTYSDAKTIFTELEDGNYTLVSMGRSDLMNSILRLSSFEEVGLAEGKDYVINVIKVESGKLSEVKNSVIPAFDESIFYYTSSNTGFSVNKSSITTGNYLTLRSAIDFKGIYAKDISNVALVVDLPDACEFVEQSVIQGPNLLPYTLDNHRLTIQLGNNYQAQTRFCVIPTSGGSFNTTASIVFDYNGRTITQPIGSANCTVKDLSISFPYTVANTSIPISGTSISKSNIEIYDNGVLIGQTTSLANGTWNTTCELNEPYNLSRHTINARIMTNDGLSFVSESKECLYDINTIEAKTVKMSFYNGWLHKNVEVDFDLQNKTVNPLSYMFYTTTDITFIADITCNDTTMVKGVTIKVYTDKKEWKNLIANYDDKQNKWVAVASFSSYNLPIGIKVEIDAATESLADTQKAKDDYDSLDEFITSFLEEDRILNEQDEIITEELNQEKFNLEKVINSLENFYGIDLNFKQENDLLELSEEEFDAFLIEIFGDTDSIDDDIYEEMLNVLTEHQRYSKVEQILTDNSILVRNVSDCSRLSPDQLILDGFKQIPTTNGILLERISDNMYELVDFSSNVYITYESNHNWSADKAPSMAAIWSVLQEQIVTAMKNALSDKDKITKLYAKFNSDRKFRLDKMTNLEKSYQKSLDYLNKRLEGGVVGLNSAKLEKQRQDLLKKMNKLEKLKGKMMQLPNSVAKINKVIFYLEDVYKLFKRLSEYYNKINALNVPDCIRTSSPDFANVIDRKIEDIKTEFQDYASWRVSLFAASLVGDIALARIPLLPQLLNLLEDAAIQVRDDQIDRYVATDIEIVRKNIIAAKKKYCKDDDDDNDNDDDKPHPTTDPIHDPSGFVYEAVPENRVEGVQASIYYKETKEDMYGDPYEEIVLWDAEEYAQKNPLFTDENGMYQWDVPQGLWQVKFEKDGYETTHSDWLPVPPPQLDVNIGIVQNKQPEVREAHAYEEGIEVQFDKYMDLSTLTIDNIYVTANGEKLNGEIRLIDSALADEYASEDDADAIRYASRVRFVPAEKISATTGEITLTVSRNVLSYAGIPMTETYSQVLDVEKEVQAIYADDVKVLYGGEKEVTVYALPYEAAVGRKLHIATSSDLITSIDKTEATLDAEGKAVVKVKGNLPGSAQLTFKIDDVAATGECMVDVVTEIITAEPPKASRASGTSVYRGTKIELTTDSKNATIYFTTDGSCPCDENGTRRKYTVPIIINEDTHILAMTSVGDGKDISEVVEFSYSLMRSDMDFQMEEGWTWISHNFESSIPASEFAIDGNVSRVLSQTKELIRDPQLGLTGNLTELTAAESYKIETTGPTARIRLSDIAWNPATPVALNPGWNWLGYPVAQTMSVDEALATTDGETYDVIVGQNGFAQYDGEKWVGTLETMSPGMGYMYRSQSAKNVVYNTSVISRAHAMHAPGIGINSSLVLDIHKYGVVMPVIATLNSSDGLMLDNDDYHVAAFCGSECRGIGRVVDGLVMMNVYGDPHDMITFLVTDTDGEVSFSNDASLEFSETVIGDLFNPYVIAVDISSGKNDILHESNVKVSVAGNMLRIKGINAGDIRLVEVYDTNGLKLIRETDVPKTGIRIDGLKTGVYVVIVNGKGEYSYHKIAIR